MSTVLEISQLSKRYGRVQALDNLSLTVEAGSVYGILGPNGSGKTTTLGILLNVTSADTGSYRWFGETPSSLQRKRIGSLLETPNFYPYLSAVKNLEINCKIKGIATSDIDRVLQIVKLYERKDSKFKTFSLGMKQRLAIAAALLGDPEVLVLDEPTNGLDPVGMAEVREIIVNEAQTGKTIIIASHILDEVEKMCTHIAILKQGLLIANGRIEDVMAKDDRIFVEARDRDRLYAAVRAIPQVKDAAVSGPGFMLSVDEGYLPDTLNTTLHQQGIALSTLRVQKRTLEAEFLERIQ